MLGKDGLACAIVLGIGLGLPSAAWAQEACTSYVVQEGDSLGSIATAAYGTFDYQRIFDANRELLVAGTGVLVAGATIILPCADGRLTAEAEIGAIIRREADRAAIAARTDDAYHPDVRLLATNGWAAFTDESLPGGGMFVRLVTTALGRDGNKLDYRVSYVDDVVSHIDTLLPSGAFDLGVAWDIEDCARGEGLSGLGRKLCAEFDFSDPIYEIVYGYATLADSPYAGARSPQDFAGARLCRPAGWASSDLLRNGLVEPLVSLQRPAAASDCYDRLLAGEVDVYAMDLAFIAASVRADAERGKDVVVNGTLAEVLPQGFIVPKSNPRGRAYLEAVNAGLRQMRESGEWYDIVASSLSDYAMVAR